MALEFVEGLSWAWFVYWMVVVVGLSECCVSRREGGGRRMGCCGQIGGSCGYICLRLDRELDTGNVLVLVLYYS